MVRKRVVVVSVMHFDRFCKRLRYGLADYSNERRILGAEAGQTFDQIIEHLNENDVDLVCHKGAF